MLNKSKSFSSFSVEDTKKAKQFYQEVLGLDVKNDSEMGTLEINIGIDNKVLLYLKQNHSAASFTVLNFIVDNIDEAVTDLTSKGIKFEIYNEIDFKTDEKGIMRDNGPLIAWFKDPCGNILSVIEK